MSHSNPQNWMTSRNERTESELNKITSTFTNTAPQSTNTNTSIWNVQWIVPYWALVCDKHIPLEPFVSCTNTIEWGYVRFSSGFCFSIDSIFHFNFLYHFHCIHKMNICILFIFIVLLFYIEFFVRSILRAYKCVSVFCDHVCRLYIYLFNIFAHFVSMPMENIHKSVQKLLCVWNILMWEITFEYLIRSSRCSLFLWNMNLCGWCAYTSALK